MADMPQGAAAPGAGAPASGPQGQAPGQGGGGITEAITAVDGMLHKIVQTIAQSQQIPDEIKSAWQSAQDALRGAIQTLAGGEGGEPDGDEAQGGAVSPEQGGASSAVPMSHQNMRG